MPTHSIPAFNNVLKTKAVTYHLAAEKASIPRFR
jgi:hypothetical protein